MVVFFFCFAYENLFSALMSRKGAELSTETKESIITLSESVQNKAELSRMLNIPRTTITSVLSKYRRTGTVETLMRSGRKRSFTNRDRNALKRLVKSNRWLTLQDITAKLNECKTNTFSQKTVQRVLYSEGYKRGLAKRSNLNGTANKITRFKYNRKYLALHEERATKVCSRHHYQKWSSAWNPERVAEHRIGLYEKPLPVHTWPPKWCNWNDGSSY